MGWPVHFYDAPTAAADIEYWAKVPTWSIEEIVALSLGKDPRVVSSEKFVHGTRGTEFSTAYFTRLELAERAQMAGQLSERTSASSAIDWAEVVRIAFPKRLARKVRQLEERRMKKLQPQRQPLHVPAHEPPKLEPTYSAEMSSTDKATQQIVQQQNSRAESRSPSSRNEKLLDLREQQNLQLMVAAMAIKSYKFSRTAAKNDATQKIVKHLSDLGVDLSKATVLKNIRKGIELLEERGTSGT